MPWGQPEPKAQTTATENLFLKIVENTPEVVRIVSEEPIKRIVHKIRSNGKIKAYINCPGYATCPICKLPKSSKDPNASYTILTQTRYFVPVLNRNTDKVQIMDIPKTPKDEIDMIAAQAGDPRNYDIVLSRIGNNTKPMYSSIQKPISPENIEAVNKFLSTVNVSQYAAPNTPEDIRKILDEQHRDFVSNNLAPKTQQTFTAPVAQVAPVVASANYVNTGTVSANPFLTKPESKPVVQNPFAVNTQTTPFVSPKADNTNFTPNSQDSIDEQLFGKK